MTFRIELGPCINCGMCRLACPTDTIKYYSTGHRTHVVVDSGCIDCGICQQICPVDCIISLPEIKPSPEDLAAAQERARVRGKTNRSQLQEIDERVALFVGKHAALDTMSPQYFGPESPAASTKEAFAVDGGGGT